MPNREAVFSTADGLWVQGIKPSVRNITARTGGSARDISPLLKMWWYERSQDRRDATGGDLAKLEVQFDEQRRFFMLEIDKARQEKKAIELELVKAQGQIERYKKIFKDGAPPFL